MVRSMEMTMNADDHDNGGDKRCLFTPEEAALHGRVLAAWGNEVCGVFEPEALGVALYYEIQSAYEALVGRHPLEVDREWGGWMEDVGALIFIERPEAVACCVGIYLLAALECRALRRESKFFLLDGGMAASLAGWLESAGDKDWMEAWACQSLGQRQAVVDFADLALRDDELLYINEGERGRLALARGRMVVGGGEAA